MTIIIFIIDTSASMNQKTYLGISLLDVARNAVETFIKFRSRDQNSKMDRYMLLSLDEPPYCLKSGWKENMNSFLLELKNLRLTRLSNIGQTLRFTFDMLNVSRIQSGVDTYGLGRCPFYMEPAVIICLTDGKNLTSSGLSETLELPGSSFQSGSELTKEPFRWDQRLFSVVLKIGPYLDPSLEPAVSFIPRASNSPIDLMSEVTGGRSFAVHTQKMVNTALETIVQKLNPGVVVNFEKFGPDIANFVENVVIDSGDRSDSPSPMLSWKNVKKMIFVHKSAQKGYSVGHWPIPESHWPDLSIHVLPPRSSQPTIFFSCHPEEAKSVENFPFDKYELEPSALTKFMIENVKPTICWQVFVWNSSKYGEHGQPFGYLKVGSQGANVNLFVHPYNYPVLLPLVDELIKSKCKPSETWKQRFSSYLKGLPLYYYSYLNKAFSKLGAMNLIGDETCLNYSIVSYLKKVKNAAKAEYDGLVSSVGQTPPLQFISLGSRMKQALEKEDVQHMLNSSALASSNLQQQLNEFANFAIPARNTKASLHQFRNPFDIPRGELLKQIGLMKVNILQSQPSRVKLVDEYQIHSLPIQQMGNYQEYIQKQAPPLRKVEEKMDRPLTFGNPFMKPSKIMIDEADEAMVHNTATVPKEFKIGADGSRKRRQGPIDKNLTVAEILSKSHVTEVAKVEAKKVAVESEIIADLAKHADKDLLEDDSFELPNLDDSIEMEEALMLSIVRAVPSKSPPKNSYFDQSSLEYRKARAISRKLVRRPGKNFNDLFKHLKETGEVEFKRFLLEDTITEARRFKRTHLVELLSAMKEGLVNGES